MRISITLVKIQLYQKLFFTNSSVTRTCFGCKDTQPLEISKWFKWYNACCTYFFPLKQIVQQFLEVAPEVLTPFPGKLSIHWGSPSGAHFTHTSQNGASCLNIQLADDCDVFPPCVMLGPLQAPEVPFRGWSPCTKPVSRFLDCRFEAPHTQQWTQAVRSQEQHPEPPPPESSIYYGTRNSRGEAFSGKCDENRKQESKSPVSTFHRQSF